MISTLEPANSNPENLPCYLVNSLTSNSAEQCKFIIDNDCLDDEGTIDYVYLVYCELGYELRYAAILLIVFLVIVLFLTLSSVADEFLCPSLLSVAKNLRMSDSLAGVTLLAFGNGCPDIFASLAAASSGRPELIVGELLGAGIFCTSIVAGLIFIHGDFKVATRPLLRDAVFYLLAVYLMWFYCWGEQITFYGSLTFIIIYVIYLIVALSGQAIHARLQGDYPIGEIQNENQSADKPDTNENWFKWRDESLRRKQLIEGEALSAMTPFNGSSKTRVQYNENGVTSIHLGSHDAKERSDKVQTSLEQQIVGIEMQSSVKIAAATAPSVNGHVNQAFEEADEKDLVAGKESGVSGKTARPQVVVKDTTEVAYSAGKEFSPTEWDNFLASVNPIDLETWRQSNVIGKLINIIRAPLLFVVLITVPVVDRDKRSSNWNRLLNSLHCITVPLFIMIVIKLELDDSNWNSTIRLLVVILSCIVAITVFKTTNAHRPPKYHAALAYFGFTLSILWIYLLASEIISLLKTVGIIFSMTDTAIGLGILAWGNSLGDIVANMSLAEAGYPRMALGASIGAPLLNLLLGFGLAFTVSLKPGQISPVEYSPTISLLCSTLALILISLMLSVLVPPEKSRKPFGYLLIGGYCFYFMLAICFEFNIIKFQ